MTADWIPKAEAALRDRKVFPTSGLRGMIKVAREAGDTVAVDLYRAEISRRRAEDKQAKR
ncbi:hypothetical protein F8O06_02815 [Pseudoclavibacter sp. CFCC 14310]|uniref:hypothetical protein n=1 Tax=Pseudoclavibacter sp. CFCC 14310 TaxID=2615180 RepID=UPI0013013DB1|nr:hypothetical protein [Pseudoclavibacter sp. CFCC 14310]KAB1647489.1 hypothetical protein F8O06_02815 [Pseudoclavibacter sp. CFCC 14310]